MIYYDSLIHYLKKVIKFILGYKDSYTEYNKNYGNVIKYKKCQWDKHFLKTVKEVNLLNSYKTLIKGMDSSSIEVISSSIGRLQTIQLNHSSNLNIFTNEEESKIFDSYMKLQSNIVKLNENCFAYKNFILPLKAFEISTFIYNYGLDNINKDYLKGKSVIDAGAYIGDSCILFEQELKNVSNIYGFEPSLKTFELMKKTIEINESKKIIPVNLALGESNSSLLLSGKGMGMTLSANEDTIGKSVKETVNVVTLDSYVEENGIEVGLIKTDLEGFEQSFLKGAMNTIKKYKPTLMISIYHSAQDYFQIKPMIESLNLGYKFSLFKADDGYLIAGTLLICQIEPLACE